MKNVPTIVQEWAAHQAYSKRTTNRDQWGNWRLRKDNWTLVYAPNGYEIDLEEICTCGAMLDWIFQLCGAKQWMSVRDGADLIEAFRQIFNPQANMCSYRGQREINAPKFLRERYQVQL